MPYQGVLDNVDSRTSNNYTKKRQKIVEHPFGAIKSSWGFRQFLRRISPRVTSEVTLAYLAYNLCRLTNIFKGNNVKILTNEGD